jgi:hypothetical protein
MTNETELDAVIHLIRERALRQAMAECNRTQPDVGGDYDAAPHLEVAFRRGHQHACIQLYDAIERMIASEAPVPEDPVQEEAYQAALSAYWTAESREKERAAYAHLRKLGHPASYGEEGWKPGNLEGWKCSGGGK